MADETGGYILEKGEESLIGRAWLTVHAQQTIDVQYFPFDEQECEMKFGSWTYDGFQVRNPLVSIITAPNM